MRNFVLILSNFSIFTTYTQRGNSDIVCALLRAGANPSIVSKMQIVAREIAERKSYVEVLLAIDAHSCRKSLIELCVGMHAADFPVLVVLEIHAALCSLGGLHEAAIGRERQRRSLPEGHLKDSVSWEIAKKVKHYN